MNKINRFPSILITALLMVIVGLLMIFLVDDQWEYHDEFSSVGLSLLTTALIAITLDRISLSIISKNLNDVVENGIGELNIRNYGVDDILDHTPYPDLYESIRGSREFIIVQTWCPYMKPILKHAAHIIRKGGKVKVFLIHPDSVIAAQRSLDLEEEDFDHVPSKTRTDSGNVHSMFTRLLEEGEFEESDLRSRLSLYYYASLPAFALYKTDSKAWMAFYWHGTQSDDAMTLVVDLENRNNAAEHIEEHLEVLEKNAIKVDLNAQAETKLKHKWQKFDR